MPALLIGQINVTDETQYDKYKRLTPAAIEKYGGRFISRGGAFKVFEGQDAFNRVVVIEFPSLTDAEKFYASPEYTEAKAVRKEAAIGNFVAVETL